MSEVNIEEPLSVVHYVQRRRMALLMDNNDGSEGLRILLRDTAKTSMDELRIVVEEKGAKAKGELAAIMADIVMSNKRTLPANSSVNVIQVLDSSQLPQSAIAPGETSTDPGPVDYEDIAEAE